MGAPEAPTLPTNEHVFIADHSATQACNEYLFRLNPNSHRRERDRPLQQPDGSHKGKQKLAPMIRNWTYSYSFTTDCASVSVLCGKRTRVKDGEDEDEEEEDEMLDPNRKSK